MGFGIENSILIYVIAEYPGNTISKVITLFQVHFG